MEACATFFDLENLKLYAAKHDWRRLAPQHLLASDADAALAIALRRLGTIDEDDYLARYRDIKEKGMDALCHFIKFGCLEGRHINLVVNNLSVDIVLPVYNALEHVKKCLASLLTHCDGLKTRIIIVDDCSEAPTRNYLDKAAAEMGAELIRNTSNMGYTRSVNIGLSATLASRVVLLNSDTIVTRCWLAGLIRCMDSNPQIGIVGPLSNAAGYQGIPVAWDSDALKFCVNTLPTGCSLEDFSLIVRSQPGPVWPKVGLINGFCFMIRRDTLDAIGLMDELNFPEGYGEEDDYCMRAHDAGFICAVADDVYVWHGKTKSFTSGRRDSLSARGRGILLRKHGYDKMNSIWIKTARNPDMAMIRERYKRLWRKFDRYGCHV